MSVKLYYDFLSQPSRALFIFLKTCGIPFESKFVNLGKGEQYQPAFEKVNPHNKVPVIEHNGINLTESVAILRYLCREFDVADHWYPQNSKAQAKVDEYLEWQHLNTRLHCAYYVQTKLFIPMRLGKPPRPEIVSQQELKMKECLDELENIWLKNKPFLTGNEISIADILGACEVEQPRMTGFSPEEGRPNIAAWLKRVHQETSPYYDEAHVMVKKMAKKYGEPQSNL